MLKRFLLAAAVALCGTAAFAADIVTNPGFAKGIDPWWKSPMALKLALVDGQVCINVPGGSVEIWDLLFGQNKIPLKSGGKYRFSFKAQSRGGGALKAFVQIPMPPWTPYATIDQTVTADQQTFATDFTVVEGRKDSQIVFQFGGSKEAWLLCLDDVSITPIN
jgi:endoglucanase